MYIVFDTETTGRPKRFNAPWSDTDNWPRLVQLAWILYDQQGKEINRCERIIKPDGFVIPQESINVHRISNERANEEGVPLLEVLQLFNEELKRSKCLVGHNVSFDINIMGSEFYRANIPTTLASLAVADTMKETVSFCKLPGYKGKYKWPKLEELHQKLFGHKFEDAHDAMVDVEATARCFWELNRLGVMGSEFESDSSGNNLDAANSPVSAAEEARPVVHFGVKTHFSLLCGAGSIDDYIKRAKELNHPAIAIADYETMSGTFSLWQKAKANGIKPICGTEIYLNDTLEQDSQAEKEKGGYPVKILIKNKQGYVNLNKLIYMAHTQGFDGMYSRICTDWLIEHKEGLIVTTGNFQGYMASLLFKGHKTSASKYWGKLQEAFQEDFIAEIKLNEIPEQKRFNGFVLKMAAATKTMVILDNDVHYVMPEDNKLQDTVVAIKDGRSINKAKLEERRKLYYLSRIDYYRLNQKFGYNYPNDILKIFMDNTLKLAERCDFDFEVGVEKYPKYIPTQDIINWAGTEDTSIIIRKMAFAKLKQKLNRKFEKGKIPKTQEVVEEYVRRLEYELQVIGDKKMLDYFLVNWEILRDYRQKGYETGSARGCFVPGTRVMMDNGMYSPIEAIEKGEKVIDVDGVSQIVLDTLEYNIEEEIITLEFENGKKVSCTKDHEFFTNNRGWVKAHDLTEEDDIREVGL